MSDEVAIQQTLNRYSDGCSRADWPQVEATFLPDGVWIAPAVGTFTGWAEMFPVMSGFVARMDYFVQLNAPALIAISGDKATARSIIRECGRFKDRDEALEVLGVYSDQLLRTPAGWRFASRTFKGLGAHRSALNQAATRLSE